MNSWRDVLSGIRMLASAGVYDDYVRDEFRSRDDWALRWCKRAITS